MTIKLDKPDVKKGLIKDMQERRSCREFTKRPLNKKQLSLIIWAAAGKKVDAVTQASRTVPSAGAAYPIEVYVLIGKDSVQGIDEGLYHYSVEGHLLEYIFSNDKREDLTTACLGQSYISAAPISIILAAKYSRTTSRYGEERGPRYVHMDIGHASQNIYLIVTELGLGTVEIGAFSDEDVKKVLSLDKDIQPLVIMPIGHVK